MFKNFPNRFSISSKFVIINLIKLGKIMKNLEVLAPCGDLENFETAINSGADAVYLGLSQFNARMKANNFNNDNFRDIIKKAHLFNTKVYLTVNTIIKNNELSDLKNLILFALNQKVDAFIVQDLAVSKIIHELCPSAHIHASTQLGVHNLKGAKVLEKLGFKRVVLSREAKLKDIKEIAENTNLEIEYFVHGALCVAFSGNCYFSSLKFGESGNRGRCLQLCRLPYSAFINNKHIQYGYLLSPHDLCLIKNLKSLIDAGVTSFKIEGRLKRPAYVAQTIQSYKTALSYVIKNKDIKNIDAEILNLRKVFSRGNFNFNAYLFDETPNEIINKNANNHIGIKIGKVLSVKPFKDLKEVQIKSDKRLALGDGLKFLDGNKEIGSMGIGNVNQVSDNIYIVYTKNSVKPNNDVYLTLDKEQDDNLLNNKRKLDIECVISAMINKPLTITLKYGDIVTKYKSNYICPEAINKKTTCVEIKTQIEKTSDTVFVIKKLKISENGVFIPKSILNELRRTSLEKMSDAIIDFYESKMSYTLKDIKDKKFDYSPIEFKENRSIVIFENLNELKEILKFANLSNTIFAYSPSSFNSANIYLKEIEKLVPADSLALNLPIIANYYDLQIIDNILSCHKDLILIANNVYALDYINHGFKVIGGTGLNISNNLSANVLKQIGVINIIQSVELNQENFLQANNYCYSFGYFTLMTFAHCPHKTINGNTCASCSFNSNLEYGDQKNRYKIRRYQIANCYFELLNSYVINIIGKTNKNIVADLRDIDKKYYKSVLENIEENSFSKILDNENFGMLLKELK